MQEFHQFYISDYWNQYIFGEIVKFFNLFNYEEISAKDSLKSNIFQTNYSRILKQHTKNVMGLIFNNIPKSSKNIYFSSSMFGEKNQTQLEFMLKQFPTFFEPSIVIPNFSINHSARSMLKPNVAKNEFEELLEFMIPMQIPLAYMEGYKYLREKALYVYPDNVKAIFTANSYHFNEGFKVWSAEKTSNGTKLLIGQHGGNMGSCLISSSEDYQVEISDKYYSWGWEKSGQDVVKPLPAIQLLKFKKDLNNNLEGDILHVLGSYPRYSYIMYSVPISSQFLNYLNQQIAFFKNLSESVLDLMNVRLDSNRKYNWSIRSRLKDSGFGNIIKNNDKDFLKTLSNCRLCIATTNSTSILETFTANFPTLLFWDSTHWELRTEAKPFYEMLHENGILHYTPESAARKLNEIFDDPATWWNQNEIQESKDAFCAQFANISANWIDEWKIELNNTISKSN